MHEVSIATPAQRWNFSRPVAVPARMLVACAVVLGLAGGVLAVEPPAPAARGARVDRRELEVTRVGGVALVRETLVVVNPRRAGEHAFIELPLTLLDGGTITAATVTSDGLALAGRTLDADAAAARFRRLRDPGAHAPAPVGLLALDRGGSASLELDLLAPGSRTVVTVDAIAPLAVREGEQQLELPCEDATIVHTDLRSTLEAAAAAGEPCLVRWPSPVELGVSLEWAYLPLGHGGVARVELVLGRALQAERRPAHVVFVVDASRSQGVDGVAAELELVRVLAAQLPHSRVAVVTFARHARVITPGLVPAGQLAAVLGGATVTPANGSNLVAGLTEAAAVLRGTAGPARVYVLTDRELPFVHSAAAAMRALTGVPRDTLVHVIQRHAGEGEPALDRLDAAGDDVSDLGLVLAATGGMLVDLSGGGRHHAEALARVTAELVEPRWLDELTVEVDGAGWHETILDGHRQHRAELSDESPLRRGMLAGWGESAMARVERRPAQVTVTGRVWGRTVRVVTPASESLGALLPALAAAEPGLLGDDLRVVGLAYRLVTSATSYLFSRPGAGPSTEGELAPLSLGSIGCRSNCSGRRGHASHVGILICQGDVVGQLAEALVAPVAACVARHGAPPAGSHLVVETAPDEILGVWARGPRGPLATCLEDAGWALDPPAGAVMHTTVSVAI
jgi:hypothetical protein